MKFVVDREKLFSALQKVQSVVEKKNTVQILGNFLCDIKGQELSLCATDLEVGVKVNLPVESNQEGRLTLSAKHFLDIVKELPNKPIEVTRKENDWVEIVSGKSRFSIVSLSAEEFPALPNFEEKKYFDSKVETLRTMIDMTSFALSTDATRYHLNGVYFEKLENNLMRMTATDGHRLSFIDQEVFLEAPDIKRGFIIPKKGLAELRKLLELDADSVGFAIDQGYIFTKTEDTYLFVRLIEGDYPDYRQVIPKQTDQLAEISRDDLIAALRRVSLLAHEKSKGIKMNLKDNVLEISTSNPDMGEAREEMDIKFEGEPTEIGFNAKYLLDCLPKMTSDELEFRFKDRLSPGVFRGKSQQSHTYVVMPMRI